MHLWFVLGTAAELIKVYPLMQAAGAQGWSWTAVSTGQSPLALIRQAQDFSLPVEKFLSPVKNEKDLAGSWEAMKWFGRAWRTSPLGWYRHENSAACMLVHGDTLSTLVGAHWGKQLRLQLVHVEAGLRSPHLFSPFPEEINRRLVSRQATLHLAPDAPAVANLEKAGVRGQIVNTAGNTLADTLRMMGQVRPRRKEYALVNIHRFENLRSKSKWRIIQNTVEEAATINPVTWVLHPQTRRKLNEHKAWQKKLEDRGVIFVDRLPFSIFIKLLSEAAYLISDGGSNQEESFYLGKPCLILREESERGEGLGENVVLSNFDEKKIREFLLQPQQFTRDPQFPTHSPCDRIIEAIGKLEGSV